VKPADTGADLVSVREVALLLGVHPETIRRLIRGGGLAGVRVGRGLHVARDELARCLEQQRVRPARAPR
jgi:excisionase family DNA binding protein